MKQFLLLLSCLICAIGVQAQYLYGLTSEGGTANAGVITRLERTTNTQTTPISFNGTNGDLPVASLVQATDGKLYGMTFYGGSSGQGVLFSYDPATAAQTKLLDFNSTTGYHPEISLVQATDGKLYGGTALSGNSAPGVLFSYDPAMAVYTKIFNFDGANGNFPNTLMQATDGKLYGMTFDGGNSGNGVIYSFDPATAIFTKLYDFDYTNGATPYGSLVQATDGKLYGMTAYGGGSDHGVIFSFDPATHVYSKLFDFNGANGANPTGNLTLAADGNLYGGAPNGGNSGYGVLFSFNPVASAYNKLYEFDVVNGDYFLGSLLLAADNKFYGMTKFGGTSNLGVAFSFDAATAAYTKLKDFTGPNGAEPFYADFIEIECEDPTTWYQDADGDGYGNANSSIKACTQPQDYVADNTDCDDAQLLYTDADGDGYGAGAPVACGVANNTDCNDEDNSVHEPQTYYYDSDGDGYGDANSTTASCSSTPPQDYVLDNTDCNDEDGSIHEPQTYYYDGDQDGYGDGNNSIQVCASTPPDDYVADNSDCNDGDNTIYPNAPELCDNKDNNCNGTEDEGCQPTSINMRINDKAQYEGNRGKSRMRLRVILSQPADRTITVDYHTENNTATAPGDYVANSGTLTFQPGDKFKNVVVRIQGDTRVEPDETFSVVLSNPSAGIVLVRERGTGTILNDDGTTTTLSRSTATGSSSGTIPTLKVSPNPANSIAVAQLSGFSGTVMLSVTDAQGKVMQVYKLQSSNVKIIQQQLNVAGLVNGTYFITAMDEKDNRQTRQVVIAH